MPPPSLNAAAQVDMPLPQPAHRPPAPANQQPHRCPRCDSANTKFCYYNNYSLSQPRHFCKACKRYWTRGGTLRNVPVGGSCRKNKRVRKPAPPPQSSSSILSSSLGHCNPLNSQIPGLPSLLHTIMSPSNMPIPQTDEFGSLLPAPSELYSLPYSTAPPAWLPLQQGGLDVYAAAIAQFEENKEGHTQQPSCGDYNNNHLLEPLPADVIGPFWTSSAVSGSRSAAPSTGFFEFSRATHQTRISSDRRSSYIAFEDF